MFPLLARFCSSQRTGKAFVGRLWLDVTNAIAPKRSKKEKIRLPVAVRGSRTSVLKLSIVKWNQYIQSAKGLGRGYFVRCGGAI